MNETTSPSEGGSTTLAPELAVALGWGLAAAVALAHLEWTDALPDAARHAAYVAGHMLGLGAAACVIAALHRPLALASDRLPRWLPPAAVRVAGLTVLGALFAHWVVEVDLMNFAGRQGPSVRFTLIAAELALGLTLAGAVEMGRLSRRGWPLAVLVGAIAFAFEPGTLSGLYSGVHLFGTVVIASFVGAALTGAPSLRVPERAQLVAAAVLTASGLLAYAVPPSEYVHFLCARDGDVVVQALGAYLPEPTRRRLAVPPVPEPELAQWMRTREKRDPIPPTEGPRADVPVVVVLSIDCLRYDVASGSRRRDALPVLRAFSEEARVFDRAYTPGGSTVITLTSMFAGRYYSQLEWRRFRRHIWPHADETTRFPETLRQSGVWTVHAASFDWLSPEYGVTRGFEVQDYEALPGPRWKTAEVLTEAIIRRLGEVGDRRAFLYAHFNDPHLPYNRAGDTGPPFDRYMGEVALVDTQLGRILGAIDELGLASRTYVVITADHGEAFEEHGRNAHANSLYEELVHVPLIVRGPGIEPGREPTRVSLLDLGPTVLDVFEKNTPPEMMGQSWVPLLWGQEASLSRPIISQSGPLRAWITPDGLKVITDRRRGTAEAYDLESDPLETENIVDDDRALGARAQLEAFFEVHRFQAPDYEEPYR
ncbi:MAG: sulfatase [Sandaracinaceae bacterium]